MKFPFQHGFRVAAYAALTLLFSSCTTIGPETISRDRFDYGAAIGTSGKEQLLLNIVGLRYLDAPVFLEVASIINQYSLEGQVALQAGVSNSTLGGDSVTLGGIGQWADRPTITYTPLSGQKFSHNLMSPLPPASLFALAQAGWDPELIFRLTVRSLNGIEDGWAIPSNRRDADPVFVQLLQAWNRLLRARILGLRRDGDKNKVKILVYQSDKEISPENERDLAFIREAMSLDPEAREFKLDYGAVSRGSDQIAVLTCSILEIMIDLAWRIEVPREHLETSRTGPTFRGTYSTPLFQVHHSTERPESAYAAIFNRGFWFYIDDGDMASKRTFAMLQILLSLTESGDSKTGPVVAISN